jgi:transcriptional regulator with XRE-family HTH domain
MDEKGIDLTKLGYRIRYLRNGKGWSLSDLEKRSGVSKAYISDVENGAAGRPNIQYVYALAMALDVTLDELLDEKARPIPGHREKAGKPDLPSGLADLQRELNLTDEDAETLARVNFRGNRPRDKEGWRFLLEAIKMSSMRKPDD